MISSKNHDMIIILSVIVGVVAVLGGWLPHIPCELPYAAIPPVSEILTSWLVSSVVGYPIPRRKEEAMGSPRSDASIN